MRHKRTYVVSKDQKTGLWYAHREGYSYCPMFGSFSFQKKKAQSFAASAMGLTLDEYLKLK